MESLINTKWIFNDTLNLTGHINYNINFSCNGNEYIAMTVEDTLNPGNRELKYYLKGGSTVDYPYHTAHGWSDSFEKDKSIIITGGPDIKSEELFAFLSLNATQEYLTKNIILNDQNIDLYPRTKASLLVDEDGKTPWKPSISLATESELGGIIAKPKTDDFNQEVRIDSITGELFTRSTGTPGKDGRGIASITKTGTEGLVDTYTISYSDSSAPTTFTVTNGKDGELPPTKPDEIAHEGAGSEACVNKTEYTKDGTIKQILFKELADCKIVIFDGFKYGDGADKVDLHLAFDPYILKHSYQLRLTASGIKGWPTDVILKYTGDDKPLTWETVTDWSENKQFGVTKITKHF